MATPNRRTRALASKSGVSYESLVGLMRIMEDQGRPGADREYVGRRRQFMSDGRPYDTHNPFHFIERWGMRPVGVTREVDRSEIIVGVYKDTPARMATAVGVSRTSDHRLTQR